MDPLWPLRAFGDDETIPRGVKAMLDIIFAGLTLALFALMAAYTYACDKL